MQDKILKELQTWLCGYENQERQKQNFNAKIWDMILKGSKEK